MKNFGIILIVSGIGIFLLGVLFYFGSGFSWMGRLPGDINIEKPGVSIYFPVTTCIILSIVISLLLYIIRMFR